MLNPEYAWSSITVGRELPTGSDFWHVATVGRGCKLDPKRISALIERERCATRFWVLFRRKLTEVGSRWAGYETHSGSG
ncbi:hypothetical protein Gotur_029926 [Gossypium turneri]